MHVGARARVFARCGISRRTLINNLIEEPVSVLQPRIRAVSLIKSEPRAHKRIETRDQRRLHVCSSYTSSAHGTCGFRVPRKYKGNRIVHLRKARKKEIERKGEREQQPRNRSVSLYSAAISLPSRFRRLAIPTPLANPPRRENRRRRNRRLPADR